MERIKTKIMENIAGFLKYGIQDNIFIECSPKDKIKILKFIQGLKKDLLEYDGVTITINNISSYKSFDKFIVSEKNKNIVFVIDYNKLPSNKEKVDSIFYYLSRLGELEKRNNKNVSNVILGERFYSFYSKLSDASKSSMQLKKLSASENTLANANPTEDLI